MVHSFIRVNIPNYILIQYVLLFHAGLINILSFVFAVGIFFQFLYDTKDPETAFSKANILNTYKIYI